MATKNTIWTIATAKKWCAAKFAEVAHDLGVDDPSDEAFEQWCQDHLSDEGCPDNIIDALFS